MFQVRFADGGELLLTEAGKKKRAGVWLVTPAQLDEELSHLGPDALEVDGAALGEILRRERRQLHPLLRDQRALAGIGRAHANEILWEARLSPFRLSTDLADDEVETLATAIREDLSRALEPAPRGKGDQQVYRIHGHFGDPCPRCGDPPPGRLRGARSPTARRARRAAHPRRTGGSRGCFDDGDRDREAGAFRDVARRRRGSGATSNRVAWLG